MAKKKQKLELTWIGKDEEVKLEPRILIGGIYELPSGTTVTALLREVEEETGLHISDVLGVVSDFDYTSASRSKQTSDYLRGEGG